MNSIEWTNCKSKNLNPPKVTSKNQDLLNYKNNNPDYLLLLLTLQMVFNVHFFRIFRKFKAQIHLLISKKLVAMSFKIQRIAMGVSL